MRMKHVLFATLAFALVPNLHAQPCWFGGFYNNIANEKLVITADGSIFSGTAFWGIFRSTNGGRDWAQVNEGLTVGEDYLGWVPDLAVNLNGDIYAATFGAGVFRSTDSGKHWNPISNGITNLYCLCITIASNGDLFVGTNGGIFRSTDGGNTWFWSNEGFGPPPVYALITTPTGQLFASGPYSVYRSIDSGVTWTPANNGFQSSLVSSLCVGPNGFLYAGIAGGWAYRSTDIGDTWTLLTNGLHPVVWSLTIDSSYNILASTSDGIFRSSDHGNSWSHIGLKATEVRTMAVKHNGELLAGAEYRRGVFHSSDNGATWEYISMGYFDKWSQVNSLVVRILNLFAGTAAGVLRSTDEGATWDSVGLAHDSIMALAMDSVGRVFAGTHTGKVFTSTNNGSTWTPGIGLTGSPVLSIAVDNCGNLFAGTATQTIFRSTDHGDHWSPAGLGLPNSSVLSLATNQNGFVFVGTSNNGAFRSTDRGVSWSSVNNGLTNLRVRAIAVDNLSIQGIAKPLYVGTDQGVYFSSNNGSTWDSFGLSSLSISSLLAKRDTIVAGTNGNGSYRFPNTTGNWGSLCSHNISITALGVTIPNHYFAATADMGVYQIYDTIPIRPPVNVEDENHVPVSFVVHQNYPNPFNPSTQIQFSLPKRQHVHVSVYDILGRPIETLVDEFKEPGEYTITWHPTNLPSGVYFYRLESTSYNETKKLILLR